MDYNTFNADRTHHRREEELIRATELRRRSAERALLRAAAAPTAEAPRGSWRRTLIRWHLAPRLAH